MNSKDFNRLMILVAWIGIIIILLISCSATKGIPDIWEIKNMRVTHIDSTKTFAEKIGIDKQTKWVYTGTQIPTEQFWIRCYSDIDTSIHKGDTVLVKYNGLEIKLRK